MSIKGLTDRSPDLSRSLPRIGVLRKGGERPANGRQPGKDLDYFRVEFSPGYEWVAEHWRAIFGDEPRELQVFVLGTTQDDAFGAWYEEWGQSGLLRRCDGEEQHRHFDGRAGEYTRQRIPCACDPKTRSCKQIGRLSVMLPELTHQTGALGSFTVLTSSTYDIVTIANALQLLQQTAGKVQGIPMLLSRQPQEIAMVIDGKRKTMTKSLLKLDVDPDYTRAVILPALAGSTPQAAQIAPPVVQPQLPPASEPEETLGDVIPWEESWWDDEGARDMYVSWLNTMDLTQAEAVILTGKAAFKYDSGRAACNAVKDAAAGYRSALDAFTHRAWTAYEGVLDGYGFGVFNYWHNWWLKHRAEVLGAPEASEVPGALIEAIGILMGERTDQELESEFAE